eukprot:Gregarina_sp_Poly_1__11091@NODE_894_length_5819_cov_27_147253_g638_i0_p6_GENE_NODE_894_length_5819_cov_27_147253_g638_i0NODE_894_length_5819_cov_27_147253_g638_i0_p6_ORF_typecomplete_len168_score6_53_NODE_894_length_5819_cov_27_147253_g638_i015332036
MLAPPNSPGNVSTSSRGSSATSKSVRAFTPMAVQPRTLQEAQARHAISGSAYKNYYHKLQTTTSWFGKSDDADRFNPTVVQTDQEFVDMLKDISTRTSMRVKSVHLPPGIHMNDPRLRGKAHPATGIKVSLCASLVVQIPCFRTINYTLESFPECHSCLTSPMYRGT